MNPIKNVLLPTLVSVVAMTTTHSAYGDDACRMNQQITSCSLGAGQSSDGSVLINHGNLTVTKTTYTQNEPSAQTCLDLGATDLRADLRFDGDALTEITSGRFIQIIGLATALRSNREIIQGPVPNLYTINQLSADVNSGVEIAIANPLTIVTAQSAPSGFSFVLNGQTVVLPTRCR